MGTILSYFINGKKTRSTLLLNLTSLKEHHLVAAAGMPQSPFNDVDGHMHFPMHLLSCFIFKWAEQW